MGEKLRVTLVCNAGVLLEYRGTTLLLDGIFGGEEHPFSDLSPEVWQQMLQGEGAFSKVDYLLFSHRHPDHFSPERTLQYLQKQPVKGIFRPESDSCGELEAYLIQHRIPCVLLSQQTDYAAFCVEPHITVRAFTTQHLDKKYQDVRHVCYLLSFDDKHILFTADVDYLSAAFDIVQNIPLRGVFLNPLFFRVLRNPRFFHGSLKVEAYCVYHVPFAEDDALRLRQMVRRDLQNWPEDEGPAMALTEPWQTIEF